MAERRSLHLSVADGLGWLKPESVLLEWTCEGKSERSPLDKIGVSDFKGNVTLQLPEGESFKLMIQADYYVHFDNIHDEQCEGGFLQLPVNAGDEIKLIDYSSRTKMCPNIPTMTLKLWQSCPRRFYSLSNVFHGWLRFLYLEDGKYKLGGFEAIEDMPGLSTKKAAPHASATTRLPPHQQLWLVLRKDTLKFENQDKLIPLPEEASGIASDRFLMHPLVMPFHPGETVEVRPVVKWEDEEMETALHEVLVTAPRPITHEALWEKVAKKLEHGIPNDRETIFNRLQKLCQQNAPYSWRDTDFWKPLMKDTHDLPLAKLLQKSYRVHIFFRALDTSPGGNSFFNTIRYVWEVKPDKSVDCVGCEYQTFDGNQSFEGPWNCTTTENQKDTVRRLEELIQVVANSSASVNSVYNIVDTTSRDNESELVDWSTVEIVVYSSDFHPELVHMYPDYFEAFVNEVTDAYKESSAPPFNEDNLGTILEYLVQLELPGSMLPVFRLQRDSVYGPQYWRPSPEDKARYDSRVELISYLHESIGMKQVPEWQRGEVEESRAVRESRGAPSVDIMVGGYQPTFFRQPNVTPTM